MLKRFHVGFCDGTLADVVGDADREALVRLGALKRVGGTVREHFSACVTVPLYGAGGHVEGFYGRRIDGGTPAHLYLPGPHSGLVNRDAASAYNDRVVLTESVLDALSLDVLGIPNVIASYGAHGFTRDHEELFASERVKEVVIAFDADEAGRKGSEALAEKLAAKGISVFIATPPCGKDWNEYLADGGTHDDAMRALDEAIPHIAPHSQKSATAKDAAMTMTVEGGLRTFTRVDSGGKGIRYRVRGVRETFAASLRVSVRVEPVSSGAITRSYVDTVDLYSARSRAGFASSCADALSANDDERLSSATIERDLVTILDRLEAERDDKFREVSPDVHAITPEEESLGREFLADPRIAERIVDDLTRAGYVGEDVNKLLMYLAATSRKMDDPISVIVASQSASGKSYLIDTVKDFMPPEDVVAMTSLSDQALNYLPEDALMHTFLVMGEAVHAETVEHQVREMLSAKELSRLVTMKDEKSGEMASRLVRKKAVVALAMSTTNADLNPENASRCFVVSTDESEAQTRAVHDAQRKKYSLERLTSKDEDVPSIIARHHAAQRLLEPIEIVNPYAHLLDFPARLMRTRRDHGRFLDLIASACFLRQFQKERKVDARGAEYIECDMDDYALAYGILKAILPSTLSGMPAASKDLYAVARNIARTKASRAGIAVEEATLTQREMREASGLANTTLKRNLHYLVDNEYLVEEGRRARGYTKAYRLFRDEDLSLVDLSSIPTPETLVKRAKAEGVSI